MTNEMRVVDLGGGVELQMQLTTGGTRLLLMLLPNGHHLTKEQGATMVQEIQAMLSQMP